MSTTAPALARPFDPAAIWAGYQKLVQENPKIRARDAAQQLGISEAMLVASRPDATLLRPEFREILEALGKLGPVMALTRNESCVHEKRGTYPAPEFSPVGGIFHSRDIDLRFFFSPWHSVFAVREKRDGEHRYSLQFFDHAGDAIHKIWLEAESDEAAFDALVERFAANQPWAPSDKPMPKEDNLPVDQVDKEAFLQGWRDLKDTHDFYPLLRKHKLHRLDAMRLADERLAVQLSPAVATAVLEEAAKQGVSIMVFVGNPGMIQIHTGPVQNVKPLGPWINVLDHGFNLHLRTDRVAEAWRVTKPTVDGDVNSIELFDPDGELIAQFFGERKPGIPEAENWRALLCQLEEAHRV